MSQSGHTPTHTTGNSQQPCSCQELTAEATPLKVREAPWRRVGGRGETMKRNAMERRGRSNAGQSSIVSKRRGI